MKIINCGGMRGPFTWNVLLRGPENPTILRTRLNDMIFWGTCEPPRSKM
jgi:hypothetical protein